MTSTLFFFKKNIFCYFSLPRDVSCLNLIPVCVLVTVKHLVDVWFEQFWDYYKIKHPGETIKLKMEESWDEKAAHRNKEKFKFIRKSFLFYLWCVVNYLFLVLV